MGVGKTQEVPGHLNQINVAVVFMSLNTALSKSCQGSELQVLRSG